MLCGLASPVSVHSLENVVKTLFPVVLNKCLGSVADVNIWLLQLRGGWFLKLHLLNIVPLSSVCVHCWMTVTVVHYNELGLAMLFGLWIIYYSHETAAYILPLHYVVC